MSAENRYPRRRGFLADATVGFHWLASTTHLRRCVAAMSLASLVFVATVTACAQGVQYLTPTWVGAPREDYLRLLQLTGVVKPSSWLMRSGSAPTVLASSDSAANPWHNSLGLSDTTRRGHWALNIFDPNAISTFNSRLPAIENIGALWSGRGVSGAVDGGVELRYGPVWLTLAPSV